jgi:hypothetical protein
MRRWTMALMVTIGPALSGVATAESYETLTIRVLAVNHAGVSDDILERAEHEATRIFSLIRIGLLWTNTTPASDGLTRPQDVTINIVAGSLMKGAQPKTDALGVTLRATNGKIGTRAYAFYRRIEDLGHQHRTDVARILGRVIAHEMGHMPLPYDSHTPSGLMRGGWDSTQMEGPLPGRLAFTPDQARRIRTQSQATFMK